MTRYMMLKEGRGEKGFTYIALLILLATMGVGLLVTEEVAQMTIKRDREEELLFAGNQIRKAIIMYYRHTPGKSVRYPMSLEDLLKDPRYPGTKRYLRKIYLDPVVKNGKWELIKGANGEIFGVHSTSVDEPIKKSNFSFVDQSFEGNMKYSDWLFMIPAKYIPSSIAKPAVALTNPSNL